MLWGFHPVQAATLKAKRQFLTSIIDLLVHVAHEGTQPFSCDQAIMMKIQLLW